MRQIVAITALAMLMASSAASIAQEVGSGALSPDQPYRAEKSNPVTYDVDFRVIVTAPYKTKVLKVWIPIPANDNAQELLETAFTAFPTDEKPKLNTEPMYGNRFAYFEVANPQGGQIFQHKYKIKVWELRWNIDPSKVTSVQNWPDAFANYLRSESQSVVLTENVRKIAAEQILNKTENQGYGGIFEWVNSNLKYDHENCSLSASSEFALKNRAGHCSDYHGLCASFSRALGYPSRVTYGLNAFPKNSPSHCKTEIYLPPYGWVSFDVSETQNLSKQINGDKKLDEAARPKLVAAANRRLLSGFRDNTWYLQTRGTDYDLAPPASKRVPVVRTVYAEADGVPVKDCDAANKNTREFGYMTSHKYTADRKVGYPFKEYIGLEANPPAATK